ncbi:MAG: DUF664 domain-containing protein [Nocardioides sp.]
MNVSELLIDSLGRAHEEVPPILDGLSVDDLAWRPDNGANSVAWLIWHLTRIEDDHVCDAAGTEQAWTAEGWADRFGLPLAVGEHGYGHSPEQVAQVRVGADLLAGYLATVGERTASYLANLQPDDLERVVDTRWDPPVTLGVRLVSVVNEVNQHVGQAAYLRGLLERR